MRGVLGALLIVSLRPNKFLCLLGAFAGSPRALQECAWAFGIQFVFMICFPSARARGRFGRFAKRFTAPEEVSLFFGCRRLLGARVADCAWAAGVCLSLGMFRIRTHAWRFGRSAERFAAPEEVSLFFECLRLLGARVADCTWAAGV